MIELLVVVSIILLLTAVTIPLALPALEGRQKREAARQLNSFIVGARARARQTGRPVGVWIERYRDPTNEALVVDEMCLNLYYAEVPRPYAGDFLDSRVAITPTGFNSNNQAIYQVEFFRPNPDASGPQRWLSSSESGWVGRLHFGDQLRLNSRGPKYTIVPSVDDGQVGIIGSLTDLVLQDDLGQPVPVTATYGGGNPMPVPFQFFMQPIKSAAAPLQMPGDVVIDLNYSGDDFEAFYQRDDKYQGNSIFVKNKNDKVIPDTNPVIITFAPNGTVDRLYRSVPIQSGNKFVPVLAARVPFGTIHLLLGLRERVPASVDQSQNNWLDLSNFWVSIHPQTGMITTTEMYDSGADNPNVGVPIGRIFAREGQSMGGR